MKERDFTIDIMRTIGILLIILAHMNLAHSGTLIQIRSFDVPMMVLISGASFFFAGKVSVSYIPYIWSRIKRLIFPVWVFLLVFYGVTYIFDLNITSKYLNYKVIISSFVLYSGFGFVWIIRIFMLIAILSPIYIILIKRFGALRTIIAFQMACIALTFLYFNELFQNVALLKLIFNEIIMPSISYGTMFVIGYSLNLLTKKSKFIIFILNFFLVVLACLFYTGEFIINTYKYPPTIIYISYSIVVSTLLYYFLSNIDCKKKPVVIFIKNIAPNTIWIYLWHIPMVFLIENYLNDYHFLINYILTVTFSVFMAIMQRNLVKKITNEIENKQFSKFITQVFTG